MKNEMNEEVLYTGTCKGKWLGDILTDLPDNSMFNKVLTGCGGTTVALSNERKYVICVPFRELVNNKIKWAKDNGLDLLPVHGETGTTDEDIKSYTGKKIIVTYDSLPRVIRNINPSGWKLLIDESHKLVDSGAFRYKAIDGIIDNYQKFGSYVFMTATPVQDKYQLPRLAHIPKSTIQWTDIKPVELKISLVTDNINKHTALLCLKYLEGTLKGNAHIFINSVASIIKVTEYLVHLDKINPDDIRIICADNEYNVIRLNKGVGAKYKIATTSLDVKKINFYTSTCFEGCDIYDEDAMSYVIVDGGKNTTKIDIITTLPQIVGRIRDSKNKNSISILFTPSTFPSHTTEDEYSQSIKNQLAKKQRTIDVFNSLTDDDIETKNTMIKGVVDDEFIREFEDKLILNETSWYNKMHSFNAIHNTYYIKDEATIKNKQVIVNSVPYNRERIPYQKIEGLDKIKLGSKPDFQTICEEYLDAVNSLDDILNNDRAIAKEIEAAYPIIKDAYELLGPDKMKSLEFRQKNFREALLLEDTKKTNSYKIVKTLSYRVGEWISAEQIKTDLKSAFEKFGVKQNATGTTLGGYYEIESMRKRVDGKQVQGYKIVSEKLISKKMVQKPPKKT
jgi:hypothetical protein